jgi:hypothetical protein
LIETESSLEETVYGTIVEHLNDLQEAFPKYFPSSTDDAAWVRNPYCASEKPDGMSVQNYECQILYLILASNINSVKYLWLNSGAVFFKNIRKCLNVRCSNFFRFQQLICAKLDVQGTRQHNLNIVTDWTSHPTREII